MFKSSTLCGVGSFQFIFEFSINLDGQSKDPTTVRVRRVRVSQHFTMRDYLAGADTGYTYLHFHFSIHSIGNIISFIRSTKKNGWVSIFFNGVPSRVTKSKAQILKHKVDPLFLRFFSAYLLRMKFKVFNYNYLLSIYSYSWRSLDSRNGLISMYYVLKTRLFLICFFMNV